MREPPKNLDFQELFRFVWLQGVGNILDKHGQPKPWTDVSLVDRFYEFGYEIDKRSIQNWLSGNNKPKSTNLLRLVRVVSNDDTGYKRLWLDAFTMANVVKGITEPVNSKIKAHSPAAVIHKSRNRKMPLYSILGMIFVAAIVCAAYFLNQPSKIQVTDLKICDADRFDPAAKTCVINVSHFPADTSLIYASFKMPNAPEGQAFDRKWYREGQLFLSKEDYADSTWEGYTWLRNINGHDHGNYNLRIIINHRVTTANFFVARSDEEDETP